jgi:hypothetical protein
MHKTYQLLNPVKNARNVIIFTLKTFPIYLLYDISTWHIHKFLSLFNKTIFYRFHSNVIYKNLVAKLRITFDS